MKRALKRAALAVLNAGPVYRTLRARVLGKGALTVLCYHTLRGDNEDLDAWLALRMRDFRAQVDFLRRNYDIVSLDEALEPPAPAARPRVVLTFDDGERGLHDHLLPYVEAEGLPVTVYVATGQIESATPYWFDRVMNALQGPGPIRIDLRADGLSSWRVGPERGRTRWLTISTILGALKTVPPGRRAHLADKVIAQAEAAGAAGAAGAATTGFTPLAPMTRDQLGELAASRHVTIGGHSHCHNLLDQLPLAEASASIARSRALLQEWTGQPVRHFAYPNGNHTRELMAEIARLGFASATILDDRLAMPGADPLALSRIGIGRYDALPRFRLRLLDL